MMSLALALAVQARRAMLSPGEVAELQCKIGHERAGHMLSSGVAGVSLR